jgi:peptide/nickel transport system substrate-binding protein
MCQHPVGTDPFKFVEFRSDESIKVTKNPDYWKPDRPYLDGIPQRPHHRLVLPVLVK